MLGIIRKENENRMTDTGSPYLATTVGTNNSVMKEVVASAFLCFTTCEGHHGLPIHTARKFLPMPGLNLLPCNYSMDLVYIHSLLYVITLQISEAAILPFLTIPFIGQYGWF